MPSYERLSYELLFEVQRDFNLLAEKVNNDLLPIYIEESYGRFIENTITDIDSYIRGVRKKVAALEQTITSTMMGQIDKSRELHNRLEIEIEKRDIDLSKSVKGKKYNITDDIKSISKKNCDYIKNRLGSLDNIKFDSEGNFVTSKMEDSINNFNDVFKDIKQEIDKNISGSDKMFESSCKEKLVDNTEQSITIKEEIDFIKSNRCKNILMNGLKDVKEICSQYLSKIKSVTKQLRNSTNGYSEKDRYKVLKLVSNYNQVFKYEISRFIQYIGYMFDAVKNRIEQSKSIVEDTIKNSEYKDVVKESFLLGEENTIVNNHEILFV